MIAGIRIETVRGDNLTLFGRTTYNKENETYYCNGYSYPSEIVKEVIYSNSPQGRLTFKYPQGTTNYLKYNNDGICDYKYQQGIDRLAEYENTELSPEEVENMKTENTNLKANWDILCNKFGEIIAKDKDCESGCYSEALRITNEVKRYSGEGDKLKQRAEVAEEALKLACEKAYDIRVSMDTLSCSSCWLFEEHGMCYTHDKFEAGSECCDKWQEHFIQQAEARLKELKED